MLLKLSSTKHIKSYLKVSDQYKKTSVIFDGDFFDNPSPTPLINKQKNKNIITSVLNSINFINQTYGHNFGNLLPIQILSSIPKKQKGLREPGAVYNQDDNIEASDGIIQLETPFLLQNNLFKTNKFAQYLKKELGLSDFTN